MILQLLAYFSLFVIFVITILSIIEGKIRAKRNNKIKYRIDKVETLTGGLENDRINERQYLIWLLCWETQTCIRRQR